MPASSFYIKSVFTVIALGVAVTVSSQPEPEEKTSLFGPPTAAQKRSTFGAAIPKANKFDQSKGCGDVKKPRMYRLP